MRMVLQGKFDDGWKGVPPTRWCRGLSIDRSSIGHSARNVEVPAAGVRTNVVALLHPSFGAANQARRMKNMAVPLAEAEIIRAALKG